MTEYTVRPALPQDADNIEEVWRSSFGDSQSFVMDLMVSANMVKSATVAEVNGRICSAVFAFSGLRFGGTPAGYLYAHCTLPEFRGRGTGAAVVRAMAERCFAEGADMVCLSPANDALDRWYRGVLGMEALQRTADIPAEQAPVTSAECSLIDSREYARLRAGELTVPPELLAAQGTMYRHYGGVMIRIVLDGKLILACAEPRGTAILVRELLCTPEDEGRALRVISAHLWNKPTLLRRCAEDGKPLLYRMRDGSAAPERPGPVFPFTLD